MDVESVLELVVAYLATYALHSTLLCGLAVWVARRSGFAAPRAVERLLRAALIGGVLTAGAQFGLGFEPIGGRIDFGARAADVKPEPPSLVTAPLDRTAAAEPAQRIETAPAPVAEPLRPSFAFEPTPQSSARPVADVPAIELLPLAIPMPAVEHEIAPVAASTAWRPSLKQALVGLWLFGVAWGLASALRDVSALRRALRWRTVLRGGPVSGALAELCATAGVRRRVRVSIAPRTHVPLSFGLFRPEIALPPRTLEHLDADEQRAVLAHELAHLVRRDIAWLWLARAIGILFWFQPFNRGVARELERRAEFAADRWAHGRLGSGASLASALAEIAGWLIEERRALPAAPMARERSQLARRVEHLLDGEALRAVEPRALSVAAPLACAVVAVWAPAFGAAQIESDDSSTERMHATEELDGGFDAAFDTAVDDELGDEFDAAPDREFDVDSGTELDANPEEELDVVARSPEFGALDDEASVDEASLGTLPDGATDESETSTSAPDDSTSPEPGDVDDPESRAELDALEAALASDASPREIFEVAAAVLDREVAALESELRDLEREFAEGEPDAEVETQLAWLQSRVDRLIESRGRLRDLFLALTAELDAASAASPEDTARPANVLESTR